MSEPLPDVVDQCSYCQTRIDAWTAADLSEARPAKGDLSICIYCGHITEFDETGHRQDISADKMATVLLSIAEHDPRQFHILQGVRSKFKGGKFVDQAEEKGDSEL